VRACRCDAIEGVHRVGSGQRVAESFHSTLEFELLRRPRFATRAEARAAVAGYLEEYNLDRRHSTCGMLSPVAYEHTQAEAAA
jgi:putative transposase